MFIIGENNSEEIQQSVLSGAQIEEVNDDQEVIVSDGAFWHVSAHFPLSFQSMKSKIRFFINLGASMSR